MSKTDPGEHHGWVASSRIDESVRDATLIEHFDGAGVQTARSRPVEILTGASFDDGDVDPANASSPANISLSG